MNTAYNVSPITLRVLKRQFQHAYRIIAEIEGKLKKWSDLFRSYYFFKDYDYFLQINLLAKNEKDFIYWQFLAEGKIRWVSKLF